MVSRILRMILLSFLLFKSCSGNADDSYPSWKDRVPNIRSSDYPNDARLVDFPQFFKDFFESHFKSRFHETQKLTNDAEELQEYETTSDSEFGPMTIFMITFGCVFVLIAIIIFVTKGKDCGRCLQENCCNAQAAPTPTATVLRSGHHIQQHQRTAVTRQPNTLSTSSVSIGMPTAVNYNYSHGNHNNNNQTPIHVIPLNVPAVQHSGHRLRLTPPPAYDEIFGEEDEKDINGRASPTAPPLPSLTSQIPRKTF